MQKRFGFAILFITHDLAVARAIADDILVMRDGEIVEQGRAAQIFDAPQHSYTASLLAAAPGLDMFTRGPPHDRIHSLAPDPRGDHHIAHSDACVPVHPVFPATRRRPWCRRMRHRR